MMEQGNKDVENEQDIKMNHSLAARHNNLVRRVRNIDVIWLLK